MSDQPTVSPGTQAGSGGQSPAPTTPSNTFNPHTTVRSSVPSSASYPTQQQLDAQRAAKPAIGSREEAAAMVGEGGAQDEVDEAGLPRHATQPRDEKGRWTAEEIQEAADAGYDVEGLEPGMEHPDEEAEEVEEAPQPTIRIKVDGQEMEVDLATARAELEMNFGAKKRFTQLDQERREFLAAQEAARSRPEAFLEKVGHDPEQWAVDFLNRKVALATMSPQERELYERQEQLQAREQELRAYEQQQMEAQRAQRDAATLEMLSAELPRQLEAVGLPTDGTALSLILPHLRDAEAAGVDITPEIVQRAAQLARQSLDVGVVRTVRGLRGAQLLDVLGPEVLQEVRRLDFEAAKARKARPPMPREAPVVTPQQPQKRVVMTEAEFRERQRRRGL